MAEKYAVRNLRLCTKDCLCLYVCPTGATDTENSIIDPEKCIGCQGCRSVCPVNCISITIPRSIDTTHCLHCGNCLSICPVGAVERIGAASQAIR